MLGICMSKTSIMTPESTALRDDCIDISQDYDLRAWADKFGVDKERIRDAVGAVGADPSAVAHYLNRKPDAER